MGWKIQIGFRDYKKNIADFSHNSRKMSSASTIKLFIAMVSNPDLDKNYLYPMLNYSSNSASNVLISKIGVKQINDYIGKNHFKDSKIHGKICDLYLLPRRKITPQAV